MMLIQFADLTRDERILAVLAIGATTIVVLHFGLFEAPRLWRELVALVRRGVERVRVALDHPPSRPQWVEEEPEAIRRQQLDAVVVPFRRANR